MSHVMLCQLHTLPPAGPAALRPRALRSRTRALALVAIVAALLMLPSAAPAATGGTEADNGAKAAASKAAPSSKAPKPSKFESEKLDPKLFDAKGDEKSEPAKEKSEPASGGTIVRMIVGLLFVLGLIYGVYWLLKNYSKSRNGGLSASGNGAIEVMATTPLAPNQALHLVRIGTDVVLIGATPTSISQLGSVDAQQMTYAAGNAGNSEFQQNLHGALMRGTQPTPVAPGVSTNDSFLKRFVANLQMMTAR